MAETQATESPKVVADPTGKAFYWYGILPASEPVEFALPTRDPDPQTGDFYRLERFTAFQLWNMETALQRQPDSKFPIFCGKLRQLNTIGVRGFVFNSHSEEVQLAGQDMNRIAFPGNAKIMTQEEADRIIRSSFRHFVEFKAGIQQANSVGCNVEVWDMELGSRPPGMTEAQWSQYQVNRTVDRCKEFDPYSDKLVAEFVYLVRMDDVNWRKWPYDDYRKNPNKFHRLALPQIDREFFENPPKSIAEMYPSKQPKPIS